MIRLAEALAAILDANLKKTPDGAEGMLALDE
jgi:hypothetical protein